MREVLGVAVAAVTVLGAARSPPPPKPEDARRIAMVCLKTSEETSGMNKICHYDCAGSAAAITVSVAQLCPLTLNR